MTRDPNPVRSVRIPDDIWDPAVERAAAAGMTMSEVLLAFTRGYSEHRINAPQIQYDYSEVYP
jgi:hypothetical protein